MNKVYWFTGFSGAGKTTLAEEIQQVLECAVIIDGDMLRGGLCNDLGFTIKDRNENVRRARELASLLFQQDFNVIVSLISPMKSERELARKLIPHGKFIEVHLSTSIDVCKERDVKGLYAIRGNQMTGIGSPYEMPDKPEISIDTSTLTIEESVKKILEIT